MATTSLDLITDESLKENLSIRFNEISVKLRSAHSQQEKFEVLKDSLILNGQAFKSILNDCIFEYLGEVMAFLTNRHKRKSISLIYNKLLTSHKENNDLNHERNDTEILLVR